MQPVHQLHSGWNALEVDNAFSLCGHFSVTEQFPGHLILDFQLFFVNFINILAYFFA